MKKFLGTCILSLVFIIVHGQTDRAGMLQNLENNSKVKQDTTTATMKSASRLFADMRNLSSVIMVIPAGSVVSVLGSDNTYLHIAFEDYDGYIYASDAEINKAPVKQAAKTEQEEAVQNAIPVRPQEEASRLVYLEDKYGSRIGDRIYEGKIWKGMTAEMVKDSWGSPRKINRIISGTGVREEWQYNDTWLYIQDDILTQWGPIQ
jgi:hypothetical protein